MAEKVFGGLGPPRFSSSAQGPPAPSPGSSVGSVPRETSPRFKACRDCVHVYSTNGPTRDGRHLCRHPEAAEWLPDWWNGVERASVVYPTIGEARGAGVCGREARLWEERQC